MDVVAHLSPALLTHLRVVLATGEHRLASATDWESLARLVQREPADLVVVDPSADGSVRVEEVLDLVRRYPSLPVVIYTTLTPGTLRAVVALSNQGVHQVVLYRYDDDPRRFLAMLEQQPSMPISDALLDLLGPALGQLPAALVRAVEKLYRRPQDFATASDLAAAAGMPRRTLYRALEAAGFASPTTLVRGARALRAYAYLRDAGHTSEGVSVKAGYSSRQFFAKQIGELFGMPPRQLRRQLPPAEFVRRLAMLVHGGASAPALPDPLPDEHRAAAAGSAESDAMRDEREEPSSMDDETDR